MTTAIDIRPGSAEDVISGARAILRKGWTKNAGARNGRGENVAVSSVQATCWCLGGAMIRAGYGVPDAYDRAVELVAARISELYPGLSGILSERITASSGWKAAHPDGERFQPTPIGIVMGYNDGSYVDPVDGDAVIEMLDGIIGPDLAA